MFRLIRLTPPHGWNAVAWELAIVTLGVVIALAAQQIAEALHDQNIAAETRAEVTDELNSNLMSLALRQTSERCIDQRLADLRAIIGPDALSVEDRASIRSALQDTSTFDYEAKLNVAQALPMARKFGFRPNAKGFREMAPQVWPGGKFTPSICASIDTPSVEANKRVLIPLAL